MNQHLTSIIAIAALKRSEFGMTKSLPAGSDEVRISPPVEAIKYQ